ncbi:MAG: single-stranded DNA-binding protein [Thermodesulfobacteriota bacterium]
MVPFNQVILTGRIATSPRRQYQPDGTLVIQFPLELNDNQAEKSLIPIVAFGRLATSNPDLESGQRLIVKGKLRQRRWQTPEGRKRTQIEVIALELHRVDSDSLPKENDTHTERRES